MFFSGNLGQESGENIHRGALAWYDLNTVIFSKKPEVN